MDESRRVRRGSLRLPVVVKPSDGTAEVLQAAVAKFVLHDDKFYSKHPPPLTLFYPNGAEVVDLPEGGVFNIRGYREQTGKEYNRIVLFMGSSVGKK
jgi:hypothetical protein